MCAVLLRLGTEKEGARFCCGFLLLFLPRGVARGVGRPTSIDLQRNLPSARQNSNRIPVRLCSESVMGLVCCLNRHQADVRAVLTLLIHLPPLLTVLWRTRGTDPLHRSTGWYGVPPLSLGCGRVLSRWCLSPTSFQCLALCCAARSLYGLVRLTVPLPWDDVPPLGFRSQPVPPLVLARLVFSVRFLLVAYRSVGRN